MASVTQTEVPLGGRLAVPRAAELSPVPMAYGICVSCHGPAAPGHPTCWSCHIVARQLRAELPLVVPIFLFGLSSPVHRALVGYKAGVSVASRAARSEALGGELEEFLGAHGACLLGSEQTATLVPVPSSIGGRQSWGGHHPVGALCARAAAEVPGLRTAEALRPGSRPPRRLDASRVGYQVANDADVRGRAVIVVDDMFVSGARALSAAAALSDAGARVVAVVPLGRLVRPDHNAATAAFFAARSTTLFDRAHCALCRTTTARRVVARHSHSLAVSAQLAA